MTIGRDQLYREHRAPWVIGRPQEAVVELVESGRVSGRVLDVGCGTAEHALLCAAHGHEAWGIDLAAAAIEQGQEKAREQGLVVELRVHDALDLVSLDTTFDVVIDSGMFHTLDDESRPLFAAQLGRVLKDSGTFFLLCFSDREPAWGGPRRISEREIAATFETATLHVVSVEAKRFERAEAAGAAAEAWLATICRRP